MQDTDGFICPECGSGKSDIVTMGSPLVDGVPGYDPDDPWTGVLQITTCADCGRGIPAHLAERWRGISYEAAQKEWREVYRPWRQDG